jgi:hypothetical protein
MKRCFMKNLKDFIHFIRTGRVRKNDFFFSEINKICKKTDTIKSITIFNHLQMKYPEKR